MPKFDLDLSRSNPQPEGASGYVMPGAPRADGTRQRSDLEIAFSGLFAGRESYSAERCMREVLGLRVETVRDVLYLDLETIDAAIVGAEAREAQRVTDVRASRAAYTKQFEDVAAEYEAERRKYTKNVLPKKRATGQKVLAAIAELDADGHFAAMADAIRDEAEAGLPVSDHERRNAQHLCEAQALEAAEVPSEPYSVWQLQSDPRGWVPDCLALLRSVRAEKQREHAAEVARARRTIQLAGGL